MTSTVRILLLSAAVAATLAACQRREDKADASAPTPTAAAPVSPAAAGAPMGFDSKTQYATVKLTLPDAVKSKPDLHAPLYAAAVRDLRQFSEGAQADLSEAASVSETTLAQRSLANLAVITSSVMIDVQPGQQLGFAVDETGPERIPLSCSTVCRR